MKKNILKILIRITVSIGLFILIIVRNMDNLKKLGSIFKSLNLGFLALAFIIFLLGILSMVPRWNVLLKAQGINVPTVFLMQSVLIGFFYNNILPTNVGGDAYRVYDLKANRGIDIDKNISAIIIARFTGVAAGFIYLCMSIIAGMYRFLNIYIMAGFGLVVILIAIGLIMILAPRLLKIDRISENRKYMYKFRGWVLQISDTIKSYRENKRAVLMAFLYTMLIQLLSFISYYLVALSLDIRIGLMPFLFIIPVTSAVSAIPIIEPELFLIK